eukprot:TRINITY_DN33019_c0_g1_i1.p1 TRINITY_DN33019_c0_g1~~TRINITY_DN33019_c0_g1_i1.p1  ORF type:complete len:739 (+),score=76.02 TRINITY_DN33019_c0_g1_i1:124-2340(+)
MATLSTLDNRQATNKHDATSKHGAADKSDRPTCPHWARGLCKLGEACRFLHPDDMTTAPKGQRRQLRHASGTQRPGHLPLSTFRRTVVSGLGLRKGASAIIVGGGKGRSACQLAIELHALHEISTIWLGPAATAATAMAGLQQVQTGLDRNIYHRSPSLPGSPTVRRADTTPTLPGHVQIFVDMTLVRAAAGDADVVEAAAAQVALFAAAGTNSENESSQTQLPFVRSPSQATESGSISAAVKALRQCDAIVGLHADSGTVNALVTYCAATGKSFALAPSPTSMVELTRFNPPPTVIMLQGAAGGTAVLWAACGVCSDAIDPKQHLEERHSLAVPETESASEARGLVGTGIASDDIGAAVDTMYPSNGMAAVISTQLECRWWGSAGINQCFGIMALGLSGLYAWVGAPSRHSMGTAALLLVSFCAGWLTRMHVTVAGTLNLPQMPIRAPESDLAIHVRNSCGCKRCREWQQLQKLRPELCIPELPAATLDHRASGVSDQQHQHEAAAHLKVVQVALSRNYSRRHGQLFRESCFQEAVATNYRRKEAVNAAIVDLTLKQRPNLAADLHADSALLLLLLDTPAWGSLQAFTSRQDTLKACQQVVIPQPDLAQYLEMIKDPFQYAGVRAQRLDHWLCVNSGKGFRIACAFLDFECRLHGNFGQQLSPAADVMRYFRFGYPADPSVLCLTVGLWPYGDKAKVSTMDEVDAFVRHEASLTGYTAVLRSHWVGRLVTLLYEVRR